MFIVDSNEAADRRCAMRYALLGLGWICVLLGILGVILPGMPGTVFLLIAVWAFFKSSNRLHRWLFDHPRWGRTIRAWHLHRAIPTTAKALAVGGMAFGVAFTAWMFEGSWGVPVAMAVVMIPVAAFIVTRPGGPRFPDPSPG
jgi:uncharacterized membrane protein YbaN (DUF454 family)